MRRAVTNKTTAALISDSEAAFDSDSSIISSTSTASNASSRRNRKIWSEAEEACLISGVGKVRLKEVGCVFSYNIFASFLAR